MKKEYQKTVKIKCPQCNKITDAKITAYENFPFSGYCIKCIGCDYIITESEWEEVNNEI